MGKKHRTNKENGLRVGLNRAQREELNGLVEDLLQRCSSTSTARDWDIYSDSFSLIEKIVNLERGLERLTPKRSEALPPFMEWLTLHGADMGAVEVVEQPLYGCCIRATAPIKEGEMLFSIPQKVMLSIDTARSSSLGEFIKNDPMLSQMQNVALAIHILNEAHDDDSFWRPYLTALPSSYDTVMYYTSEEIRELRGSPAYDEALRMCRNIARQYAYFYSILQKNRDPALLNLRANFTYTGYRWAVSTVMTRQNVIPNMDGQLVTTALIPLWDFCNHQDGQFSTDFHTESRRSVCHANRDFGAGEQVFIFYGRRTCADQLVHNGFVDTNNGHDALVLRLGLSKSDPLAEKRVALLHKLQILKEEKLTGPIPFQLNAGTRPVDGPLLAFLRIFCMTNDPLDFWLKSENTANLMYDECGIETEVDNKSWNFLKGRCQLLLQMYPTTKEDDLKRLEEDLNPHLRTITLLRLAEKRILLSAIEYAEHQMKK